jgi:protein involved in ribonucleotide reduction
VIKDKAHRKQQQRETHIEMICEGRYIIIVETTGNGNIEVGQKVGYVRQNAVSFL